MKIDDVFRQYDASEVPPSSEIVPAEIVEAVMSSDRVRITQESSTLEYMTIAIVADWLTTIGGAEHVVRELLRLYPNAHLFTTVAAKNSLQNFLNHPINTTSFQHLYRLLHTHQILLPWLTRAVEDIDLTAYDIIISSSHAIAKGIVPPSHARHITYCHTPMRYAWEMEEQYLDDFGIPTVCKPIVRAMLKSLRRWDLTTAKRVDTFIANSSTTAERIKRIYHRESVTVHPPVDDRFFEAESGKRKTETTYFLAVGRLVPYKKFDLLVETANRYKLPLKIVGQGREKKKLKTLAGPTIEFLGHVRDEQLPSLYADAQALLFPTFEDAGVVPLEAQACGTPVIAYGKGGATDTVKADKTGIFFEEQTAQSLIHAIQRFQQNPFDPDEIKQHAKHFSAQTFRERIGRVVQSSYEARSGLSQR